MSFYIFFNWIDSQHFYCPKQKLLKPSEHWNHRGFENTFLMLNKTSI